MDRFKICPSCGEKNSPALFECMKCETDLTRVPVTSEEAEAAKQTQKKEPEAKPEQTNETPIAADTGNTVRVCECGTKNPPNARKCSACGEDISDITPTPDTCEAEQEKGVPFMITSVDGKYAFEIPEGETVIGREHTMKEYLKEKLYVSREHCKITNNCNGLFVENLAKTNYTYLNNEKVTERTKLSDGDELGLGGISRGGYQDKAAYFTVRINKCS